MAQFFINRPVFAMVIAIVIVILGAVAIPGLPISAYPQVVPPSVQVTATYLGGNDVEYIDRGRHVVVPNKVRAQGRNGIEVSAEANQVFTLEPDGRVSRPGFCGRSWLRRQRTEERRQLWKFGRQIRPRWGFMSVSVSTLGRNGRDITRSLRRTP